MGFRQDLDELKTPEEVMIYLQRLLKNFKTLYSRTYTDYDNTSWTKNIKAYEYNGLYIVLISNYEGFKIAELHVCLTNKRPKEPHPLFPIKESFLPKSIIYSYPK